MAELFHRIINVSACIRLTYKGRKFFFLVLLRKETSDSSYILCLAVSKKSTRVVQGLTNLCRLGGLSPKAAEKQKEDLDFFPCVEATVFLQCIEARLYKLCLEYIVFPLPVWFYSFIHIIFTYYIILYYLCYIYVNSYSFTMDSFIYSFIQQIFMKVYLECKIMVYISLIVLTLLLMFILTFLKGILSW